MFTTNIRTGFAKIIILAFLTSFLLSSLYSPIRSAAGESKNQQSEKYFTILHTNDEHSSLVPHSPAIDFYTDKENPTVGGYARLATAAAKIREQKEEAGEPVLIFSAGDFMGGAAFSWLIPRGKAAELTLKQKIGYDAVTIGNHEFDYSPDILASYLLAAGYPAAHEQTVILATNTTAPEGHPLADRGLLRQTALFELENGINVGVFGIIGDGALAVTSDTGDLTFLPPEETALWAVQELKKQGAHIIVALSHSGLTEDRLLAQQVPGIDIIVGGHCHTALSIPVTEGDTIIVQAGAYLESIGLLELAYDPSANKLRVRNEENNQPFLQPLDAGVTLEPEINRLISSYTNDLNQLLAWYYDDKIDGIMDTVASSDFVLSNQPPLRETPLGNFVTDAMRLVTARKTGSRVTMAAQADGSIRGSVFPGTIDYNKGNISFYDLVEVVGLGYGEDGYAGYPIVSFYLTGEEICRVLEAAVLMSSLMGEDYFLQFSGIRYSYNPADTILFTIPFLNRPLPSTRAVQRVEIYTGEGVQSAAGEGYKALTRGDQDLYHVATDTYILSFLPMVGELIPWMEIVPKFADGSPVPPDRFTELVVYENGRELKVWQTVVEYAAGFEGKEGRDLPQVPDYYKDTANRISQVSSIPLIFWPAALLCLLLFIFSSFVIRRRKRNGANIYSC